MRNTKKVDNINGVLLGTASLCSAQHTKKKNYNWEHMSTKTFKKSLKEVI